MLIGRSTGWTTDSRNGSSSLTRTLLAQNALVDGNISLVMVSKIKNHINFLCTSRKAKINGHKTELKRLACR